MCGSEAIWQTRENPAPVAWPRQPARPSPPLVQQHRRDSHECQPAGRTQFRVNGQLVMADGVASFEMPGASLVIGTNQLSVTSYAANGLQGHRSDTIMVR